MQPSTPSNSAVPVIAACGANQEDAALRVVLQEGIDPSAVDVFSQAGVTKVVSIAHAPKATKPADVPDFPEGREDPEQSAELERQQDA